MVGTHSHIEWTPEEVASLKKRVLKLTDGQIAELFRRVGISFPTSPIQEVVRDMRERSQFILPGEPNKEPVNLDILLGQAKSKESLLNALSDLETEGKKQETKVVDERNPPLGEGAGSPSVEDH